MSGYLVVGPSWVGDMVMAQSLIIALKQANPELHVDIIAPRWSVPLVQRMPQVREAIALPVAHRELGLRKRSRLGLELRSRHYRRAFILPRSFKSALVPWFAGIPKRTGYRGEWRFGLLNDIRIVDRKRTPTLAQRWMALGCAPDASLPETVPYPQLMADAANQHRLVEELELTRAKPVVALVPGAEYGSAKRWPASHFAALAQDLDAKGAAVWLLGSPKEQRLGANIASLAEGKAINLCGKTSLPDVVDLLALADGVACNDSGLMHVAAAVGAYVVALFGASSPEYTPPLTDHCHIFYLDLDCSPCFARECPLGHHNCLRHITPDAVMAVLAQQLWRD